MPPEPAARRRRWLQLGFAVLGAAWLLVRVPPQLGPGWEAVRAAWSAAGEVGWPAPELFELRFGLPPEDFELLQAEFDERSAGRLLLYVPLEQLPEPMRLPVLERCSLLFEVLHNLRYPAPHDVRLVESAAELQDAVAEPCEGPLLVADLGQRDERLPVAAPFELLRERRSSGVRGRWWRREETR
ncbi:MAG: hypothetical protein AB7O97_00615 [Planctomycetota bacterium]